MGSVVKRERVGRRQLSRLIFLQVSVSDAPFVLNLRCRINGQITRISLCQQPDSSFFLFELWRARDLSFGRRKLIDRSCLIVGSGPL